MRVARKIYVSSAAAVLVAGAFAGGATTAYAAEDVAPDDVVVEAQDATEDTGTDEAADDAAADEAETAAVQALVPTQFSLDLSPGGPYSGGDRVTGTASGFEPNEQVIFSICIGGGKTLAGPQDCSSLNGAHTALGAADADGNAELTIEVLEGEADFQSAPGYVCGNGAGEECVFSFTNFGGDGPAAVQVEYGAGGGGGGGGGGDDDGDDTGGGTGGGDDDGDTGGTGGTGGGDDTGGTGGDSLPATGAGPAAQSALLGAALLALGALLTVAGRRSVLGSRE